MMHSTGWVFMKGLDYILILILDIGFAVIFGVLYVPARLPKRKTSRTSTIGIRFNCMVPVAFLGYNLRLFFLDELQMTRAFMHDKQLDTWGKVTLWTMVALTWLVAAKWMFIMLAANRRYWYWADEPVVSAFE